MSMDFSTNLMTFNVDFADNYINSPITINFLPTNSVDPRYFASVNSSVFIDFSLVYYSQFAFTTAKIIPYLCYTAVGIGWVSIFLGIFARKLAGIEGMVVIQFAYLTMLFLNTEMYLPFAETYPLKWSVGYNKALF